MSAPIPKINIVLPEPSLPDLGRTYINSLEVSQFGYDRGHDVYEPGHSYDRYGYGSTQSKVTVKMEIGFERLPGTFQFHGRVNLETARELDRMMHTQFSRSKATPKATPKATAKETPMKKLFYVGMYGNVTGGSPGLIGPFGTRKRAQEESEQRAKDAKSGETWAVYETACTSKATTIVTTDCE
jgi:hypothetical protein